MPDVLKPRRTNPILLILAALIIGAGIFGGIYYVNIQKPLNEALALQPQRMAKIVGYDKPAYVNKLSPAFTDADGDLVADPPKDPSKLIDPDTLTFSWIAADNDQTTQTAFKDLADAIAKATGKKIVFSKVTTTEDELRDFRDGKITIAGFSTGTVPIAVNQAGYVPVGMLADDKTAKHKMLIIVPASSSLQSVADLKDHELSLTEPNSNSGFKAPVVLLRRQGLELEGNYTARYTQSYENSIVGIAKGKYQAAAVASDVLERALALGQIKKTDYRVIYESEEFPSAAIGYAYNLKPELAAKIKDVILSFNFKNTSLEGKFAVSNQSRFVGINYKNDWTAIRLIDDAQGVPHKIK